MGATANLASELQTMGTGMDPIVIRKFIAGITGGRTLDAGGFPLDIIKAGHVIIRDTANNTYKPMPLAAGNDAYAALPASHEYVGVLVRSISKETPLAAIMYNGEVNDVASPFPIDGIKSALKTALPTLVFLHD